MFTGHVAGTAADTRHKRSYQTHRSPQTCTCRKHSHDAYNPYGMRRAHAARFLIYEILCFCVTLHFGRNIFKRCVATSPIKSNIIVIMEGRQRIKYLDGPYEEWWPLGWIHVIVKQLEQLTCQINSFVVIRILFFVSNAVMNQKYKCLVFLTISDDLNDMSKNVLDSVG